MKTTSYELLVNAAGQLMQQHAFDHLSDEKLSRMHSCFRRIGESEGNEGMANAETELLNLCSEANLFVETTTTQSLHQWYAAMNCFGMMAATLPVEVAEEAE
ncbi:MAG: hypothetical protein M0Q26_03170 [Chitinophagaceae bacterium]|nr:hypothetical protein [Chitinophagaceae bacterium]MDP1762901.1 hypothetical protein [Sediminibacterium sp.]MDP1812689.1 hypothetical protein [Sediminibacterium sp.]MDP3127576.1 hypothetical protein [Sediminibacterium sp.]MDP3667328.1 hypothetical protein [Sediminibacterium sp.]